MQINPDVVIEDDRWTDHDIEAIARAACQAVEAVLDDVPPCEVVILAADDHSVAALNDRFRGKPHPTNILSWPATDLAPHSPGEAPHGFHGAELGDVALAFETCLREATEQSKSVHDHVTHLVLHGILHLFGYDHQTDADATVMEGLEIRALATLGISSPY